MAMDRITTVSQHHVEVEGIVKFRFMQHSPSKTMLKGIESDMNKPFDLGLISQHITF